jgi:hypothetical protein
MVRLNISIALKHYRSWKNRMMEEWNSEKVNFRNNEHLNLF